MMDKSSVLLAMSEQKTHWASIGSALVALGVMGALGGFFLYDPSVEIPSSGLSLGVDRVVNLQGLAIQILIVATGLILFVSGILCHGIGAIIRAHRGSIALLVRNDEASNDPAEF